MAWTVQMQEESVGRNKIPTQVKQLKFFPIEGQGGEVSFGKLGFLLLQVLIRNSKGDELKLKLNASQGALNATFTVQHPDKWEHPWLKLGKGARVSKVIDTLSPKERKPGEKEKYETPKAFADRLTQLGGKPLADEVLGLFAGKLARIAS